MSNEKDDEEQFYEELDQYRELIERDKDEELNEEEENGKNDSEDEYNDNSFDLLAEFSDYGEYSDDDYDEHTFMDAIRTANNFKTRKGKPSSTKNGIVSKQRRERPLDPEVAQLLSEANEAYVRNDIQVAEQLYNKVIKADAKNFAAYKTLGDIYHLQGRFNDCCNSWFLAAHLNSSDWEFWKMVAELSAELSHVRQAIYCYTRAIRINNEEWESMYNRALLYKEIGQLGRAFDGFQKLYAYDPLDANILRELAVIYVEYNRVSEAIELYMTVFNDNVSRRNAFILASEDAIDSENESEDETEDADEDLNLTQEELDLYPNVSLKKIAKRHKCIPFDWSSLNILAELLIKQNGELNGIKTIKKCARWIQHRETQTFWEDVHDDSEFDNRRLRNAKFQSLTEREKSKSYSLPIDIRVRLGLLRLNNKNVSEAMQQFQFLYEEKFDEIADLYFEVGVQLSKLDKYQEAIDFLTPLSQLNEYTTIELYRPLSKCFRELDQLENAKAAFEKLVQFDPLDLEHKLSLAEVHHSLGNEEEFDRLLHEVVEERKKQSKESVPEAEKEVSPTKKVRPRLAIAPLEEELPSEEIRSATLGTGKPLLEDHNYKKAPVKKKKTPEEIEREKKEREKKIRSNVLNKYGQLKIYKDGMEAGDATKTTLWIDTASDLIDIFSSIKNFFVKSRSKKFVGIIKRSRKFNKVIDYRIEKLSKLSQGENLMDGLPLMEEKITTSSTTELRGLTYDQWFELFMELALTIARLQSANDASSIIETATEVNVFSQHPERVKMMKFVKLAIILQLKDEQEVVENLRGLLNQFQFNRKILHLFMFSVSEGQTALRILSSTVQQKFFLRQLKAFDSIRFGQHVNGQASITNSVSNPERKICTYLNYIYAMLLYSSKGFMPALQYLKRIEIEIDDDPMLDLMIGLSHLHRSMQRLTGNRHFQILQGFKYLYQYHELRHKYYSDIERQEADYNIGRAYHILGLFSPAVKYYKKVLDNYEDLNLKKHAAYNLILIYNESENFALSNHLMEQYLSI
ncbi:unnamed protein product [Kluyveromyces dobzhanskii CBS 2104]|uniref:WGS project CCBQ000000000 data, contig MAT n=1 Tax=Kluyveromyces dobzhanskii CBS 2104 TaxID=1427455 RepID=A0A0A8L1Q2_9SACH|nr:unnamed protein product [Kluyveromyces dobzhanskii CBS 2104]